jgi:hypothetical protein
MAYDLRLAIERQMIAELRDQHMGQQPGPRSIGRDGAGTSTTRSHPLQVNFGRT